MLASYFREWTKVHSCVLFGADMASKKIKDTAVEILSDYLPENGYELYNIKYTKEAGDWFLKVFIDKEGIPEGDYISTDDCEKVSRYLSDRLDEHADIASQKYYLVVSSPGMDRELFLPEHFDRFSGREADLKLYSAVDGEKELSGILMGMEDGNVIIDRTSGGKVSIPLDRIAKANLAVVF